MTTPQTTTDPARRADTTKPRGRHLVHHVEANGAIHTLCGIRYRPNSGAKVVPDTDKRHCAACDAASYLYEVGL